MGIIDKFKDLFSSDAPMTSGAKKAAEGRSDLTEAAQSLDELRGDKVSAAGDSRPDDDSITNIVAAANDALFINRTNEDSVLKNSKSGYRSSNRGS